jgi:hypothetical protein
MTITFTRFSEPLWTLSIPAARNILELGQEKLSSTFASTVLWKLCFNCQMLNLTNTTDMYPLVKLTGCPHSIFNRMGCTSIFFNLTHSLVTGIHKQIFTTNAREKIVTYFMKSIIIAYFPNMPFAMIA